MKRILQLLVLLLSLSSCSVDTDKRLVKIEELISQSPKIALDSLLAIDVKSLSDKDRHFYDFLTVKISDKAYITHTSDSLILNVIGYESKHRGEGRYAESLYYGGRVYSDLGDYPNALHYFQEAKDELQHEPENFDLHANIVSQHGRLLTFLRLYDEAIPYIYEALKIDRAENDTINEIYDLILLGATYFKALRYDSAESIFNKTLKMCAKEDSRNQARSMMYLAAINLKKGQIDSALCHIRRVPDLVDPIARTTALSYAANIYLDANVLDTAYMYANEILRNPNQTNRDIAYHILLSHKLRNFSDADTLYDYVDEYRSLLESFVDENENQMALMQQSYYNYQTHLRERSKSERHNQVLRVGVMALILIAMLLVVLVLYFKNKNKSKIIELRDALINIEKLKNQVIISKTENEGIEANSVSDSEYISNEVQNFSMPKSNVKELREKLQQELMAIYNKASDVIPVNEYILQSSAYAQLQNFVSCGQMIRERDGIWEQLEQLILEVSPEFKSNLNLLSMGKLNETDWHTALLIKCGIKPKDMTILLGKSNGAIISRRDSLCLKVMGKLPSVKNLMLNSKFTSRYGDIIRV